MNTLITSIIFAFILYLKLYFSYLVLSKIMIFAIFAFKRVTKLIKITVALLKIYSQKVAPKDLEMGKNTIPSDAQELVKNLKSLPCGKGIRQFNLLDRKTQSFKVVISAQLDVNELTFIRYTDAVELMYFEALQNLQQYCLIMTSIETINESHLAARLMSKNAKKEFEIETLLQRLDLWGSQMNKADNLLIQNERILTKLDLITSQVANIELKDRKTGSRVIEVEVEKMLNVNS